MWITFLLGVDIIQKKCVYEDTSFREQSGNSGRVKQFVIICFLISGRRKSHAFRFRLFCRTLSDSPKPSVGIHPLVFKYIKCDTLCYDNAGRAFPPAPRQFSITDLPVNVWALPLSPTRRRNRKGLRFTFFSYCECKIWKQRVERPITIH